MPNYDKLAEKIEAKADSIERLEAAFSRLSFSRIVDLDKSRRIATSIIVLMEKMQGLFSVRNEKIKSIESSKKAKAAKNKEIGELGHSFVKEMLDFVFEREKDAIIGIVMDVFGLEREDAELVPFSCVYNCIMKDEVLMLFLHLWERSGAEGQSSTLPNPPHSHLQPIRSTSKPGMKKSLTGSNLKPKRQA